MCKYRYLIQTTTWPNWWSPFSSASKLLSVFLKDLAVFIFPTLLADFKDQIQNRDRVPTLWAELHMAHAPSIFFIFKF